MLRNPLLSLGALLLLVTGPLRADRVHEHPGKEPDVSFLNAEAQATLSQVRALHEKIRELGKPLHEACMPDGGGRGERPRQALSEEQKQEFANKLSSEACTKAIASLQVKLP